MPESLKAELKRLSEKSVSGEHLVFQTRNGTPFSDTNLLHQHLKAVGRKLGMPWLNWHTLRRTHATLQGTGTVGTVCDVIVRFSCFPDGNQAGTSG